MSSECISVQAVSIGIVDFSKSQWGWIDNLTIIICISSTRINQLRTKILFRSKTDLSA